MKTTKKKTTKKTTNRISDNGSAKKPDAVELNISAPEFQFMDLRITGTTPLVLNKFSGPAREGIMEAQERGDQNKSRSKKVAKDFATLCEGATYRTEEGQVGFPCSMVRNASISACRVAGFVMTRAKLSIFCEADGFDAEDSTPIVFLDSDPVEWRARVRLPNGELDIRSRPMWKPGWQATCRLRFDLGQFAKEDVINLMMRVGMQVGFGEGRPDSKKSAGMGFGLFSIEK